MNQPLAQQSGTSATESKTRLVRVRLSGLVRMEYMEVVEVPGDISADELNELVNQRYVDIDGGQFVMDPDYWERGECSAEPVTVSDGATASMRAVRGTSGITVLPLSAGPAFLVAEHYAHCFVGDLQVMTRWVMDRRTREMLCGQVQRQGQWRDDLDRVELDDVLEDIETNDVEVRPGDFDVVATDVLPAWATQQMLDAARGCGFDGENEAQAVIDFLHARAAGADTPVDRALRSRC